MQHHSRNLVDDNETILLLLNLKNNNVRISLSEFSASVWIRQSFISARLQSSSDKRQFSVLNGSDWLT